jgi:hypothetical protein
MKCEKCGYEGDNKEIKPGIYLCSICRQFSPTNPEELQFYLEEKISWQQLESFRKYNKKKIEGMQNRAEKGQIMSRAAFGYKIENKELIIDEGKKLTVEGIFRDFVNENTSLNKLAGKYSFSVNGIKKILKNFTYIGKVKFKGQIMQGNHKPIISSELFNKVQSKLENKKS